MFVAFSIGFFPSVQTTTYNVKERYSLFKQKNHIETLRGRVPRHSCKYLNYTDLLAGQTLKLTKSTLNANLQEFI